MAGAFEGRSPATLVCERCGTQCTDPRELATHLERHRPVKGPVLDSVTGKEISHRCPEDCGRSFAEMREYREHTVVCDGSEPLVDLPGQEAPSRREYLCPECRKPFEDTETLAVHLERHREVYPAEYSKRGKLKTKPCPKKCGRHIRKPSEFRSHVKRCDGSSPLSPGENPDATKVRSESERKEEMPSYVCDVCDKPCGGGAGLAAHKRSAHGARPAPKRGRPPRRKEADESALPETDVAEFIRILKEKATEYRTKADRLEELAEEIASLL